MARGGRTWQYQSPRLRSAKRSKPISIIRSRYASSLSSFGFVSMVLSIIKVDSRTHRTPIIPNGRAQPARSPTRTTGQRAQHFCAPVPDAALRQPAGSSGGVADFGNGLPTHALSRPTMVHEHRAADRASTTASRGHGCSAGYRHARTRHSAGTEIGRGLSAVVVLRLQPRTHFFVGIFVGIFLIFTNLS